MASSDGSPKASSSTKSKLKQAAPVIVVGSVMFSFISYWRVAAVVLCDLASTAYYIGGIVEQAVGKAAPWFILGVMLFSYAVRTVSIESCSMFVRGGVYRIVKEAMGKSMAKVAVSALLFDFVLTGPISAVSAGKYMVGFLLEFLARVSPDNALTAPDAKAMVMKIGPIVIAVLITLYFFRKNLMGIHESSDQALKIMIMTSIVAAIVLTWSVATLAIDGPRNSIPFTPDLSPKKDPVVPGVVHDPLGFIPHIAPGFADSVRHPTSWLSFVGLFGIVLAFGHSILAMSGEETLVQVYREVESPKLPNFKKAAIVIFVFSVTLTAGISFLAVLLIPDEVRMPQYSENLLGGLAMHVKGYPWMKLVLNAIVVGAGFLILAGAVNTSIIGSNGVLNRVAEDGVLPDTLQKPHHKYGTTHRILLLIVGMQLFTIFASGGDMILLGEAYAFGVIWSFFFNSVSMLILRFKDKRPREFRVPFNLKLGGIELPIGLMCIVAILGSTAIINLFSKELATKGGVTFTTIFAVTFFVSEALRRRRQALAHEHLEQFTEKESHELSADSLGLHLPYRKLVAIRSPENLFMLQKSLDETDPETTDVLVMTAKVQRAEGMPDDGAELDRYDRRLMTAVVDLAEKSGKHITPLIVPTNNPLFAVVNTARDLKANELIVGASNKFTAEEQLDQMALYWINANAGQMKPLTIRVRSKKWDAHLDIEGGSRIPRVTERTARSVAELRAAGIGVSRVLMVHDGARESSDIFDVVLTVLDPSIHLGVALVPHEEVAVPAEGQWPECLETDRQRAEKIGREVELHAALVDPVRQLNELVAERSYGLVVLPLPSAERAHAAASWSEELEKHATFPLCLVRMPSVMHEKDAEPGNSPAHA